MVHSLVFILSEKLILLSFFYPVFLGSLFGEHGEDVTCY